MAGWSHSGSGGSAVSILSCGGLTGALENLGEKLSSSIARPLASYKSLFTLSMSFWRQDPGERLKEGVFILVHGFHGDSLLRRG